VDKDQSTPPDVEQPQSQDTGKLKDNTGLFNGPLSQNRRKAPQKNPFEKYLYPHARVWSLYLRETEAEDKELVEFWKDGLDSLLIFVSPSSYLFACTSAHRSAL
jgi:hypothetical protein